MKYLFTYSVKGKKDGLPVSGTGAMPIKATDTDKITESLIYGEGGAIDLATDALHKEGLTDVSVAPMGWFKFDEENKE